MMATTAEEKEKGTTGELKIPGLNEKFIDLKTQSTITPSSVDGL